MAVRHLTLEALASGASPACARHVGGAAGFIDEDELSRVEQGLGLAPCRACGGYVRAVLLASEYAFLNE